jgi:hypothetical protein
MVDGGRRGLRRRLKWGLQHEGIEVMLRKGLVPIGLGILASTPTASAQESRTVAILIPGKGGVVPFDFPVRNQAGSAGPGSKIARSETQRGRKAVIVGMSAGALKSAKALSIGAPADGVVLVSETSAALRRSWGLQQSFPRP